MAASLLTQYSVANFCLNGAQVGPQPAIFGREIRASLMSFIFLDHIPF